jgi:carboxyl-terminal processing protease
LQDHDRALIIGTPTYGKGSAQSVVSFGGEGGLKLTTARWFTPSGRSITRPRPADEESDDAPRVPRERFRTDAGRVVYGGGGITPDVIAGDSVVAAPEANFIHALGANGGHFRDAVTNYALYVKASHGVASPDFVVTPAMRDEVWNRMKQRGIDIPRSVFDEAEPLVTRLVGYDIARYVFGSDAEFRRRASVDKVLQRALQMARGSRSEPELLRKATAQAPPADTLAGQ